MAAYLNRKTVLPLVFGLFSGGLIYSLAEMPLKWIIFIIIIFLIVFISLMIGSIKNIILGILIFSTSFQADFNLWWSDRYSNIQTGMPITLTILLLLTLYTITIFQEKKRHLNSVYDFKTIIPLAIIIVWAGITFLIAKNRSLVSYNIIYGVESLLIFVYFSTRVKSERDVKIIVLSLSLTVIFTFIVGLMEYFQISSIQTKFLGGSEELWQAQYKNFTISRISGLLKTPNMLSWYLVGIIAFLLVLIIAKLEPVKLRMLIVVSFISGLFCQVLTFSRGGYLSLACMLPIILVASRHPDIRRVDKSLFSKSLYAITGLIVFVLILIQIQPKVLYRITEYDYGTSHARIPLAYTAIKIISSNPITGVGLANYSTAVPEFESDPMLQTIGSAMPVHNFLLRTAAELGLPVIIIFFTIVINVYRSGFYLLKSERKEIVFISFALMLGIATFFIQGQFEPDSILSSSFRLFWLMSGLLISLRNNTESISN